MAYVRPIVMVYQEYASQSGTAQDSTLNPCVVGPCYQVMDESLNTEADMLQAFFSNYTPMGIPDSEVPKLIAGAQLDPESVRVRFTQPYVNMGASNIAVDGTALNVVTFTSALYPTGVMPGDFVSLLDSGGAVIADKFVVIEVDSAAYTVALSRVIPEGVVATAVWLRLVPEFTLTNADAGVTVTDSTGTVAVGNVLITTFGVTEKPLYSSTVYCGYKALRQDTVGFLSMGSIAEIETKLGSIVPENPLAFGASITLANTNTSVFTVGVTEDTVAGYASAKDVLEGLSNVYSIVPLTRDVGVLGIFATHVKSMSLPDPGKWRIAFGNMPLPSIVTLSSGKAYIREDDQEVAKVIQCSSASFLSDGIQAGDTFDLTLPGGSIASYLVSSIVAEDMLILSEEPIGVAPNVSAYDFVITRVADKELQSIDLGNTSKAYNSSRFYNVWPDVCVIDGAEQPGYYLCCAIAGMVAGLASQQGFTRIGIAGISAVKHSTDYFNSAQLDNVANGGTLIFTQLSPAALPTIRHQISTDSSTYEMRELSFVKNFDYVSYICKDILDSFIGSYNITPSTLAILETVIAAAMESLKLSSLPKIGSPVLDFTKPTVTQSSVERSRVEIYCSVEFPYALNTIGMHIVSTDL